MPPDLTSLSDPNHPHTTTNGSFVFTVPIDHPYLTTLMTRHTMRTAVSAHTAMTAFFRVGRCVMRDEIRDPTVASVTFCGRSSSPMTTGGVVECVVAGDERVCGSALTRQRAATAKVKARLNAPMMLIKDLKKNHTECCFVVYPQKTQSLNCKSSCHTT